MYLSGRQILCVRCSRALIKVTKGEVVTMNKIQSQTLHHKGICYRNTSVRPVLAEEIRCVQAGAELLLPEYGSFYLP